MATRLHLHPWIKRIVQPIAEENAAGRTSSPPDSNEIGATHSPAVDRKLFGAWRRWLAW